MTKKKDQVTSESDALNEEPIAPIAEEAHAEEAQAEPASQSSINSPLDKGHVPVGSKAEQMREKLKAEPKVRVLIPLANGEKPGVTQSVILNGYSLYIRKGEYVEVPESVAEVLEIKMKHKMAVERHPLRASGTGEVKMDVYGS